MNNQVPAQNRESLPSHAEQHRLSDVNLRTQLTNLAVLDKEGRLVGEVKDLYREANGQLNLVVLGTKSAQGSPLLFINSQFVHRVDNSAHSLFVNLNSEQIERLPRVRPTVGVEPIESSPAPIAETTAREAADFRGTVGNPAFLESAVPAEDGDVDTIRLLEERLVVDRSKRKIGEVIVRKEIETRMVQVPVRREKLIIEQVGLESRRLAEVDLGDIENTGVQLSEMSESQTLPVVTAECNSVQRASQLLKAIAGQSYHGCVKVRLELVLEDSQLQQTYQTWLDRYSQERESATQPPEVSYKAASVPLVQA